MEAITETEKERSSFSEIYPGCKLKDSLITSTTETIEGVEERNIISGLIGYFNTERELDLLMTLYRNIYLPILLWDALDYIAVKLQKEAEHFKVGISLEKEDEEDPEQYVIFLLICGRWRFREFDERLEAMVEFWKFMEDKKNYYLNRYGDHSKIEEAYRLISIYIGEEEDDCEILSSE